MYAAFELKVETTFLQETGLRSGKELSFPIVGRSSAYGPVNNAAQVFFEVGTNQLKWPADKETEFVRQWYHHDGIPLGAF